MSVSMTESKEAMTTIMATPETETATTTTTSTALNLLLLQSNLFAQLPPLAFLMIRSCGEKKVL